MDRRRQERSKRSHCVIDRGRLDRGRRLRRHRLVTEQGELLRRHTGMSGGMRPVCDEISEQIEIPEHSIIEPVRLIDRRTG